MSAVAKKFYHLFWTDSVCQSIFSSHKTRLLEDEVELIVTKEKFFAQRIVLTNSQKRKSGLQVVKRSENHNIELMHNLRTATQKYFDEAKFDALINSKFGKAIALIETDLQRTGGWWKLAMKLVGSLDSEKDLFKLLADYHLVPQDVQNREQFWKYLESEFNNYAKDFLKKENLSELAISIDLLSTYYNNKIRNNLVAATKHYTDVFSDNEKYQDRLELFDSLYEIGVLKGGTLKSYHECVDCPPNTLNGILTLDIKPSKLKLKCPSCAKELFYIVPYELEKTVYDDIVHKDGLLFFAIGHLLEQQNYRFVQNHLLPPDVELDYCLLNEHNLIFEIVEVKMFKNDRPDDTQVGNLRDAVSQVKKAVAKLMKSDPNFKAIPKSIVTNISDQNVYKQARKELEQDLAEYNISLYAPSDFYMRVKK